jgi:methylamine---glutamate N-methyltransferase subunit A
MCGIVGLHLREPSLHPRLGQLLSGMLCQVAERGPDSAGVAIYGDPRLSTPGGATVSVLSAGVSASEATRLVQAALSATADGAVVSVRVVDVGQTSVVVAATDHATLLGAVRQALPSAPVIGFGEDLAVLKGVGHPQALVSEFGLATAQGWQGVAHARMATESAVTPAHSHPFSVGPDQCLVHNGSFANHATIRRELVADGVVFDSDNDSEVAARFVAAQLAAGFDVDKALRVLCERFDGFYTLLVSTRDSFAVVRDAIAWKPAVIAETSQWVAMASEYRAFAGLPGIESASIFEPEPEEVYVWQR